jgi:hypothetical protein
VTVPLTATGARVPAGHRLRVAVAGSAFPVAWPPPEAVRLTLFHHAGRPSRLRLPATAGWVPATEDLGTGAADRPPAEERPGIPEAWRVERDELAGTTTLVSEMGGGHRFPERDGLVFGTDERFRVTAADDWATCVAEGRTTYRIVYPDGRQVAVDGSLVVRSDATDFDVRIELAVSEGGREVFERTWRERIPRDLV